MRLEKLAPCFFPALAPFSPARNETAAAYAKVNIYRHKHLQQLSFHFIALRTPPGGAMKRQFSQNSALPDRQRVAFSRNSLGPRGLVAAQARRLGLEAMLNPRGAARTCRKSKMFPLSPVLLG